MNALLDFFYNLLALSNPLWYYWPLAIVIGIVYKTTQYDRPRDIAKGVLHFMIHVTLFMLALAVVLVVVTDFWPRLHF